MTEKRGGQLAVAALLTKSGRWSIPVRVRRLGGLHWLLPQDAQGEIIQQRVEHRHHEQRQ
jgi:hypothetical protein